MSVESRRHFLFQVAAGTGVLAASSSGSAVAHPIGSPNFGINVCDYGADPTGQLESKAAFEAAINAAYALVGSSPQSQQAGAVIFVPRGQYRFDSQLTISSKNGLVFVGEGTRCEGAANGMFGSVILKGGSFGSGALISVSNADGFGFKGITLWGDGKTGDGLVLQAVNCPVLEDVVTRYHLGWGLKLVDCSLGTLSGIKAMNNGASGSAPGGILITTDAGVSRGMKLYDSHCRENYGPQLMIGNETPVVGGQAVRALTVMACQFEKPNGTAPTVKITQAQDSSFSGNNFVQPNNYASAPALELGSDVVTGVTIENLSFVSNYFQYNGYNYNIYYKGIDKVGSVFTSGRRASFVDCRFQGVTPYGFNFGPVATTTPSNPSTGQITFLFSPKPTNTTTNMVNKEAAAFTALTAYTP